GCGADRAHAERNLRTTGARRPGHQSGSRADAHRGIDCMSRRDQSQHAAGTKQNGVAASRTGKDGASDDLPARTPGGAALFHAGYPKGVQENLALSSQLSALSRILPTWGIALLSGTAEARDSCGRHEHSSEN